MSTTSAVPGTRAQLGRREASTRTREIEEFTNLFFVHPIGARLLPLCVRLKVSPNAVSLTGLAFGLCAGIAYYRYAQLGWAVVGFLLMIGWHILDGIDGQLARLTNRQSEFGKVIDGIADNVTFIAVYSGLGLAIGARYGIWSWLIIALAGIAHSMQAAIYELQRQEYDYWGWGKQSAEFKSVERLRRENQGRGPVQRIVHGLGVAYAKMQQRVSGLDLEFRERIATALATQPDRAPLLRQQYRETFAGLVRRWSIMCANYRTLGIFTCAVLHVPIVFFLIELVVLAPLTLLLVQQQKSKSQEFSRLLDQRVA